MDQGLDSVPKLLGLGKTLASLKAKNVTMITMPTLPDNNPGFSGRLLPELPQADVIFQMVLDGQNWRHGLPTLPPSQVKVHVLNGSGLGGLAGRAARRLRKLGYDVTSVGNATAPVATTTVTYSGTAQADSAYTLATALKSTPAAQNLLTEPAPQTGAPGSISLIIGPGFTGVNPPPARSSGAAGKSGHSGQSGQSASSGGYGTAQFVQTRSAGASICSGLPKSNPNSGRPPGG